MYLPVCVGGEMYRNVLKNMCYFCDDVEVEGTIRDDITLGELAFTWSAKN